MSIQIFRRQERVPPLRIIVFGGPGTWKTSTLGCAKRALWLDFHGSTATFRERPDALWDPETGAGKPSGYPDLVDALRAVASDKRLRAEFDWLIFDGLDDIEEQYLIPEALRSADAKSLDENYFKPCNHLLRVHQEFRLELEALSRAGWNLGFTCHAQNIERVNADGANTLVCDMKLTYISGKLGKWDISPIWRDWVDHCVYLDMEGGKFAKLDKEKLAKGSGSYGTGRAAYLRGEPWLEAKVRRLDGVKSPQIVASPDELWSLLEGQWRASFAAPDPALEALRIDVLTLCVGAPKAEAAARRAATVEALEKIKLRRQAEMEGAKKGE
jgi:hypothetical protein